MGAQQHVPAQVERILGVEGRVILGEIEGEEIVPFGLGLGTDGAREPELAKDLADLVHDLGDEVEPALPGRGRSEEHTSELQSQSNLVCRLLLEKKKKESASSIRD